jgi:hypothetical protein
MVATTGFVVGDHGFPSPDVWYSDSMHQDRTPILEAIEEYRRDDNYTFALPGHRR